LFPIWQAIIGKGRRD